MYFVITKTVFNNFNFKCRRPFKALDFGIPGKLSFSFSHLIRLGGFGIGELIFQDSVYVLVDFQVYLKRVWIDSKVWTNIFGLLALPRRYHEQVDQSTRNLPIFFLSVFIFWILVTW
jgi:hypothetical protein